MQRGDVAKAHKPFWICLEIVVGQLVDELNGAISATVADDGFNAVPVESPTQVADTFLNSTSIFVLVNLAHIGANDRCQSPTT